VSGECHPRIRPCQIRPISPLFKARLSVVGSGERSCFVLFIMAVKWVRFAKSLFCECHGVAPMGSRELQRNGGHSRVPGRCRTEADNTIHLHFRAAWGKSRGAPRLRALALRRLHHNNSRGARLGRTFGASAGDTKCKRNMIRRITGGEGSESAKGSRDQELKGSEKQAVGLGCGGRLTAPVAPLTMALASARSLRRRMVRSRSCRRAVGGGLETRLGGGPTGRRTGDCP
jgi:hypothetical protein